MFAAEVFEVLVTMWPFSASSPASTSQQPPAEVLAGAASAAAADKCPVDHETRASWLAQQTSSSAPHPLHASTSAETSQPVSSKQKNPAATLPTSRVISSIPRANSSSSPYPNDPNPSAPAPSSDDPKQENWVYPSQAQFYNAMLRKDHKPRAEDMETIVPIHNAVNERAWTEVLKWEKGLGGEACGGVQLLNFVGKPKERTIKAWWNVMLGYQAPFDRHDWIVTRCGTKVRYIIDFYTGKAGDGNKTNLAFYLDARPAVDSWDGAKTRLLGWWNGV